MADNYDNNSHWHACKREVLGRIENIKSGDYSTFFDYSSDFWLSLCIAYFVLSEEFVTTTMATTSNSTLKSAMDKLFDENRLYDFSRADAGKRMDKYGLYVSQSNLDALLTAGDKGSGNGLYVQKRKFIDEFRNALGHAKTHIEIDKEKDLLHAINNGQDYKVPVHWIVDYVDVLCGGKILPPKKAIDAKDDIVNAIGNLYRLYTTNWVVNESSPKPNESAVLEIENSKEEMITALLYVAGINMYALNYQDNFDSKIETASVMEKLELEKLAGYSSYTIPVEYYNQDKTYHETVRNCFVHPGRITIKNNGSGYDVKMDDYDYDEDCNSGSLTTDLDSMIKFISNDFFKKEMSTNIQSSNDVRIDDKNSTKK